ncbi:two-pore potassium channel 3-like isoform X2 [Wolffia australiana]
MENEPLLSNAIPIPRRKLFSPSTPSSILCPLPEDAEVSLPPFSPTTPSSLKDRLIFGPPRASDALSLIIDEAAEEARDSEEDEAEEEEEERGGRWMTDPAFERFKSSLHRSRTAPAMAAINDVGGAAGRSPPAEPKPASTPIVRQAVILLAFYLTFGVLIYMFNRAHFSHKETHPLVDALYFCIVTMCTIGYGDITPHSTSAKLFSVAFVLVGFGFVDILLSGMVSVVLDLQERLLLSAVKGGKGAQSYLVDVKKGRMRIRMKVSVALGAVVLCIGLGAGVMHYVEELGWVDSVYLSVMSVTTVGYGDRAFETLPGRLFASVWLLVSTLAVARAFLYLAEARIDKRHRSIAKWALHRHMTVAEFLAADIDHNGFVTSALLPISLSLSSRSL